jgi:hypothetical protein
MRNPSIFTEKRLLIKDKRSVAIIKKRKILFPTLPIIASNSDTPNMSKIRIKKQQKTRKSM